jgi:hypothetical protein
MDNTGQRLDTIVRPKIIKGSLPVVETTFQLLAKTNGDFGRSYDLAIGVCLEYFVAKMGNQDASAAQSMDGFINFDIPGQSLEVASIPDKGIWAARCMFPDGPVGNKSAVAGRTWVIEVSIRRSSDHCCVAISVKCASQPYAKEDFLPLRPAIVRQLHMAVGLYDQRPLLPEAWMIEDEEDLDRLAELIRNPKRSVLVHVLSQNPGEESWLVVPNELADETLALAHVVALPARLLAAWNERIGELFGLLPGAVRSYLPTPAGKLVRPANHPLIAGYLWPVIAGKEQGALIRVLYEQSFLHAAGRHVDWGDCLFYREVRLAVLKRRRQEVTDLEELQTIYQEENDTLLHRIDELKIKETEYCQIADQCRQDKAQAAQENQSLRANIKNLRAAIVKRTAALADPVDYPHIWQGMEEWVLRHFEGRLLLHPRASQGIKDAEFRDPSLAYHALYLLATDYRNMKLGITGARQRYEDGLGRLGLHNEPAINHSQAGQKGEAMYVDYPLGSGCRQILQMHLKKGVDRDTRNLLRIYYFWDNEEDLVVIGWLPGHL